MVLPSDACCDDDHGFPVLLHRSGDAAIKIKHGRALHMAQQDLARAEEEVPLLVLEVRRVAAWVSYTLCSVAAVLQELESKDGDLREACAIMQQSERAAHLPRLPASAGQQFLLVRWLAQLQAMRAEVASLQNLTQKQ
jgi:hypothetical protein